MATWLCFKYFIFTKTVAFYCVYLNTIQHLYIIVIGSTVHVCNQWQNSEDLNYLQQFVHNQIKLCQCFSNRSADFPIKQNSVDIQTSRNAVLNGKCLIINIHFQRSRPRRKCINIACVFPPYVSIFR